MLSESGAPSISYRVLSLAAYVAALLVFAGMVQQLPTLKSAHQPSQNEELSADDSRQLWETSQALFREGRYEEAIDLAHELHSAYPESHIYMKFLARSYHRLDRPREEAIYWEKYMELSPTRVSACTKLGEAYRKLGQNDKAIGVYERCVELAPRKSELHFFLGHSYERSRRLDEARTVYLRGLELSPDSADLQLGLARVLMRLDKVTAARVLGLKVLAAHPDYVDALLLLGQVYRSLGDLDQAKRYLNRGVELKDSYTDFHRLLASIAEREGDGPRALYHARKVLERDPGDERAAARVARVQDSGGK